LFHQFIEVFEEELAFGGLQPPPTGSRLAVRASTALMGVSPFAKVWVFILSINPDTPALYAFTQQLLRDPSPCLGIISLDLKKRF
jgi:hypothetical protein